jgi:GrpB-like predicted nucleotidyltransferase (UPF0157 family)
MTEGGDIVAVVDYDPDWPARFAEERVRLAQAFGDDAVLIEHIGGTSIPGLAAKPIIDVVVAARNLPLPSERIAAMEALGYEHMGEYGIAGRAYFRRRLPRPRTHHVHVYATGSDRIADHLLFRDYLRARPAVATRYADLKRKLASQNLDGAAFQAGKSTFIAETLERARRDGAV